MPGRYSFNTKAPPMTYDGDDLKLTPALLAMLERIERHSGTLLMLAVTASGRSEYAALNKLRSAGYVVKCDHPSVKQGAWPAEALAITKAGRTALDRYRAQVAAKKDRQRTARQVRARAQAKNKRAEIKPYDPALDSALSYEAAIKAIGERVKAGEPLPTTGYFGPRESGS